jgi:hypothetical protein
MSRIVGLVAVVGACLTRQPAERPGTITWSRSRVACW